MLRSRGWAYFTRAEAAAEDLGERLCGVSKAKASILTRAGFDQSVRRLAVELTDEAKGADAAAVKAAARKLDAAWPELTAPARAKVLRAAARGFLKVPAIVVPKIDATLREGLGHIVSSTREAVRASLNVAEIGADLTAQDKRIVDHAARSQGAYITDQYGVRATEFEGRARGIVADGLERGLGRDDIAEALTKALIDPALGRAGDYWHQVASIHVARARTYGHLAGYTDAGIEEYEIVAVGDEVTCVICEFMDGKTFGVAQALEGYTEVEDSDDPYAVEDVQPFVRVGASESGERFLYVENKEGRHAIARVGEGKTASRSRLESLGCAQPPFHGRCRCTTVGG